MIPQDKTVYIRCGFMPRYCALGCPHCKEGRDTNGKLYFWCWLPFALYEKPAILLIEKSVTGFDDYGNLFISDEVH